MENIPWGTKVVQYDCNHFVWSNWFDMIELEIKNGVSYHCIFLSILVVNPSHVFVLLLYCKKIAQILYVVENQVHVKDLGTNNRVNIMRYIEERNIECTKEYATTHQFGGGLISQ